MADAVIDCIAYRSEVIRVEDSESICKRIGRTAGGAHE